MNREAYIKKLKESLQICKLHYQRMDYALNKIKGHFPLKVDKYNHLSNDDLSYLDQLIFRFSKLQDTMGTMLFPSILDILGEDTQGVPFIDLLVKMEKLNLVENHKSWLKLRDIRNLVNQDYPVVNAEVIEGLNQLIKQAGVLEHIWLRLKQIIADRFKM